MTSTGHDRAAVDLARRVRYKSSRRCGACGAGLQDEDGVYCVEHRTAMLAYSRRYNASPRGRETTAARMKRIYDARVAIGECVGGCGGPALPGLRRCQEHHDAQKETRVR